MVAVLPDHVSSAFSTDPEMLLCCVAHMLGLECQPSQCLSSSSSTPITPQRLDRTTKHSSPSSSFFPPLICANAQKSAALARACVTLDHCVEHPQLLIDLGCRGLASRDASTCQAHQRWCALSRCLTTVRCRDRKAAKEGAAMLPRRKSGLWTAFPQGFSQERPLEMLIKAERVHVCPQSVFINAYVFVE